MTHIVATEPAFPEFYYSQREIAEGMVELCRQRDPGFDGGRVWKLFDAVGVQGRHMSMPLEAYLEPRSFGAKNEIFLERAVALGQRAIEGVLRKSELDASEVALLMTTTVTGIAVPSLDARLMNRVGFDPGLRRVPLFGLGCVAGAAGIARVHDYLHGHPTHAAILLSVELCSLTQQRGDLSTANVIASGLFGDGAAAVLLVGKQHRLARSPRPVVTATRSVFFRDTERVMGWDLVDSGLKIVLGKGVPELARNELPRAIQSFLSDNGLGLDDIDTWVAHPGGPAVIDGLEQALGLGPDALSVTRQCLSRIGNLSSASVLVVLHDTLQNGQKAPSSRGLLVAMGPGFCAEIVLLEW